MFGYRIFYHIDWNDVKTLNCRNYEGVIVFKVYE